MSATTVIHSAHIVGDQVAPDGWVRFRGDKVDARGTADGWRHVLEASTHVVDAGGHTLVPGFIDIHGHGGGGVAAEDGPDAISTILATHRMHGTTRSVLSLVTAAVPDLCTRLRMIADATRIETGLLGAHLEGPFLSEEYRGAHDRALLRDAQREALDDLLSAADGTLRQVTLAPERPGAFTAIERLLAADVRVAVGHTSADAETSRRAFDAGASILTHAFNGMRGIHHRAPGPVIAALQDDRVTLEIIGDGVHVDPRVIALAFAAAPERIALITDAMAAAGAEDGSYRLGTLDVVVCDGVARLAEGDSIAGSTLTQDAALRRAVRDVGLPLATAVRALTCVPAAAIGRAHDLGALLPGYFADAVLLDDDLRVTGVWASGLAQPTTSHHR